MRNSVQFETNTAGKRDKGLILSDKTYRIMKVRRIRNRKNKIKYTVKIYSVLFSFQNLFLTTF